MRGLRDISYKWQLFKYWRFMHSAWEVPFDSPAVMKSTVVSQVHGEKIPGAYFLEADDTLDKCEFLCTGHLSKALLFCVLCRGFIVFGVSSLCLSNKKMRVFFQYLWASSCIYHQGRVQFKIPDWKCTSENKLNILDNWLLLIRNMAMSSK